MYESLTGTRGKTRRGGRRRIPHRLAQTRPGANQSGGVHRLAARHDGCAIESQCHALRGAWQSRRTRIRARRRVTSRSAGRSAMTQHILIIWMATAVAAFSGLVGCTTKCAASAAAASRAGAITPVAMAPLGNNLQALSLLEPER